MRRALPIALSLCAALALPVRATPLPLPAPPPARPAVELGLSLPAGTALGGEGLRSAKELWLRLCREARRSLDIGQFYATSQAGSDLAEVIEALRKAGQRGVRIRFLVDTALRKGGDATLAQLRAIPNLTLREIDWGARYGGVMHAKYWVADGERVYIGSQNFDWRSLQHIHELGALVADPAVARGVSAVFEQDFSAAAQPAQPDRPRVAEPEVEVPKLDAQPPRPVELFGSPPQALPPGVRWTLPALLELIGQARRSLRLQLLTYSPVSGSRAAARYFGALDQALRAAAVRGVKVELLFSDWVQRRPDIDHIKSLALVPGVTVRLVHIPEAPQGFIPHARVIHSKYLLLDGEVAVLGTSNWSRGYFYSSRNLELVLRDAAVAAQLAGVFQRLWDSPYAEPLDINRSYQAPRKE